MTGGELQKIKIFCCKFSLYITCIKLGPVGKDRLNHLKDLIRHNVRRMICLTFSSEGFFFIFVSSFFL